VAGKRRKYLHISLGIGVTAICLWLAVPGSGLISKWEGLKATAAALKGAEYWWLVVLMAILTLFFLTKAYRWALLLSPIKKFRTHQVFPATMIGFMGNNVLPAHLGEFLRMYVLSKTYTISKTPVLSSIVLERVLDAMAIGILFGITGLTFELPEIYKMSGMIGAAVVVLALLSLTLFVYCTDAVLRFWEKWFRFVPQKLHSKIAKMITGGSQGLETLRKPRQFLYLVVFSIIHWALIGLYIYLVLGAFSIDLPVSASLLVLCVSMVGVTIPSAPGYWGVIQAVFTFALKPFGVTQELALAASVYYLASQYVPVTVTGLIFMGRMGFHLGELKSQAEREALAEE
jgi:uncharacterized protein (TIRG00374 family)